MNIDNSKINVLIVDDELEYRDVIQMILEDVGYVTDTAESGEQALVKLKETSFQVVLTDLKMGNLDGIELLKMIKARYEDIEVILITGNGTIENAVDAMKIGAYNYIVKTQPSEKLLEEMEKVCFEILKKKTLKNEYSGSVSYLLETRNAQFKQTLKTAEKAARSNANILILGESGVGKEVVANYIHECSARKNAAFIPVNCSSLSESLLESELFGHEKGAFTGALNSRGGMFETADRGTLFLDEIGDISLSTQVKLLRALETKKIQRIGSNELNSIDFRLICATNKDLEQEVKMGRFREDFLYRINTITIEVPPLRERQEDIKMFIDYFIDLYTTRMKKGSIRIDEEVMDFLLNYHYEGNIREMKNMIERLVVLSEDGRIMRELLSGMKLSKEAIPDQGSKNKETENFQMELKDIKPLKEVRQELEVEYIEQVLKLCKHNVSEAARKLDLSRRQLYNKMNQYGL